MMINRLHIASFIGLTVLVWLLALWIQGYHVISVNFLRPFGIVVVLITLIVFIFNRWAWSWKIFRGWYVNRPDLRGTWKVILKSDWIDPNTGKPLSPITAYAAIRQTLTSLSFRLYTPESRSKSIAYSLEHEENGLFVLSAIYRNEPKIELQGTRSEIHHGAISLEVYGFIPGQLEGHYWTDRNTRGSMRLSDKINEIIDNFEDAQKLFNEENSM